MAFMNKGLVWAVLLIIVLIGGWYWYSNQQDAEMEAMEWGTYAYQCDTGATFTMSPSGDISTLLVVPGEGASFAETTLTFVNGDNGQRFEGEGMVFVGAGEGVSLTAGGITHICEPVPNPDEPPFNWGDTGEGAGSMQQDAALIVSESIQGRWQSTQDAKSVRVFNADFTVEEIYDGETLSTGLWVAFTKMNAPEISFTLEENTVYLQITESGTPQDTLTFKVTKLTPEELELIYMDRGGALTYTRVE